MLLANDRAATGFAPGDHGSTFGGSPVPCAAALAHLRVRDELDLDANVRARSRQLFAGLGGLTRANPALFGEPRGVGLLVGLPVREPNRAAELVAAARDRGLLIGSAGGNTLRFAPPLIITKEEVAQAITLLHTAIPSSAA